MRLSSFVFFLCISLSSLANDDTRQYGPKDFSDVPNKWTAVVAAYEPEIEAIDAAFATMDDAQITQTLSGQLTDAAERAADAAQHPLRGGGRGVH